MWSQLTSILSILFFPFSVRYPKWWCQPYVLPNKATLTEPPQSFAPSTWEFRIPASEKTTFQKEGKASYMKSKVAADRRRKHDLDSNEWFPANALGIADYVLARYNSDIPALHPYDEKRDKTSDLYLPSTTNVRVPSPLSEFSANSLNDIELVDEWKHQLRRLPDSPSNS